MKWFKKFIYNIFKKRRKIKNLIFKTISILIYLEKELKDPELIRRVRDLKESWFKLFPRIVKFFK